jgi:hypothetical protein
MSKHLIDVGGPRPLLDIASYARRGPGRDPLTREEIELISRTAARTPEVIVKVLTRGGQDFTAIRRHLQYLDRNGALNIETDDGQQLAGKGVEKALLEEWNLDLEEVRRRADLGPRKDRRPPKLAHKILFSMPPGTAPEKVLEAVKNFAREEFAFKHRYAMVLHTDEPHPHVHMVVKAVSEKGARLNIKKATLRNWRQKFAENLRREGIAANATERAVRGVSRTRKTDGIYRTNLRGESWHVRDLAYSVAETLRKGSSSQVEEGTWKVRATRRDVELGWRAVSETLEVEGRPELAAEVRRFAREMLPPRTERELLATGVPRHGRAPDPQLTP